MSKEIILSTPQKENLINRLYEDIEYFKNRFNEPWIITTDKSLDPVRNETDDKTFPYVLLINGVFEDALSEFFVKEILGE